MCEVAMVGWKAIANMFSTSERKMKRHKAELQDSGTIFYMWRGTPPRRCVMAFPSMLIRWSAIKAHKGETL